MEMNGYTASNGRFYFALRAAAAQGLRYVYTRLRACIPGGKFGMLFGSFVLNVTFILD